MNIMDLIRELQELSEIYPDADVRLATQPNWPLEYSIGSVVASETEDEDIEDEDIEDEDIEENVVIYIAEGSQIGYLPGIVSKELGWR